MELTFVTLGQRPDLHEAMWSVPSTWPEFMFHDPVASMFFGCLDEAFPEYQVLGLTPDGSVVARVNSVPFDWDHTDEGLPDRGWDAVLEQAFVPTRASSGSTVSLLEARVDPAHQGSGLSAKLLQAAAANARRLGAQHLLGPVRPTRKSEEPRLGMADYVHRCTEDGLPFDPWLRTHVRLGGRIVRVCPASMTISATLAQWLTWTGIELTRSGLCELPGALVPIHVSIEQDHAVYVEPNVWVHHRLTPTWR
ncbi:MAG: GNAT family N-acetyltransferase [Mycobacteriales bacterium]